MRLFLFCIILVLFAFAVLGISFFRTSQPDFAFYQQRDSYSQNSYVSPVEYYMPYHGMMPSHPLWPLKATRDRAWIIFTRDPIRKAHLYLLFADKRVSMASQLFEDGEGNLGVATALKAEQYLEEAWLEYQSAENKGMNTADFLQKLARACLKHREMLESFVGLAPSDAKPRIVEINNISILLYAKVEKELVKKGIDIPAPDINN